MSTRLKEDRSRLVEINGNGVSSILEAIARDCVVLVRNLSLQQADDLIHQIAGCLGLSKALALQAELATLHGHRSKVGKYFMSVNQRDEYQFITPHSEGAGFMRMQISSFYCLENSTDGGETLLFNVDGSSRHWSMMKEKVSRLSPGSRPLSISEASRIKLATGIYSATDFVRREDIVIREYESHFPGVKIVDVLGRVERSQCRILGKPVHVLWDTVASFDRDQPDWFKQILIGAGLLREPQGGLPTCQLDNTFNRRIFSSGIDYSELFRCSLTHRLAPGELIIQNNYTWAHSTANWTPHSGKRTIAASFA